MFRLTEKERNGLHRVIRALANQRLALIILVTSGFFAAVVEGGTIGILGLAVSVLIGEQNVPTGVFPGPLERYWSQFIGQTGKGGIFLVLVGIAITAQIAKNGFLYINKISEIYLNTSIQRIVQHHLTEKFMSMTYQEISQYPTGRVASIIEQGAAATNVVAFISNVSRASMMIMAYIVILVWMSPLVTFSTIVIFFILWISLNGIVVKLRQLSEVAVRAKLNTSQWTVEYLNVPKLLRIFNGTDYALKKINDARDGHLFPERKAQVILAAIPTIIEIVTVFGAGVFLIVGYILAGESAVRIVPKLFVFIMVFWRLKPQVSVFNDFRMRFSRTLPPLSLIGEILGRDPGGGNGDLGARRHKIDSNVGVIDFDHVSLCYSEGGVNVLSEISFSIKAGQTVALVGESGAGKTTIVNLLLGLFPPTEGRILIDGKDIAEVDVASWRQRIGVVEQDSFLLNSTIRENIAFVNTDATWEEIRLASQQAYATEFIESFEDGYEAMVGDLGHKLSGGQKQRVALARALVRNPDILVLDEATSALDSVSEQLVQRALEELHHHRTMVIIAHRLSTIRNADMIIVLDKGKIIEQGSPAELLNQDGYFRRLWEMQTG